MTFKLIGAPLKTLAVPKASLAAPKAPEKVSKAPESPNLRAKKLKKCTTCGKLQPLVTSFAKHNTSSDGRASICNSCRNIRNNDRRKNNPDARLKHLISSRCLKQFPDYPGLTENLEDYLGYKISSLRKQLDKQSLEDFGLTMLACTESGNYHIDHVEPLSHFKTIEPGDAEFRACWTLDNLVMITAEENLKKGART